MFLNCSSPFFPCDLKRKIVCHLLITVTWLSLICSSPVLSNSLLA